MKRVLLILILSLALSACLKKQVTETRPTDSSQATPVVREMATKESYRKNLKEALVSFWNQGDRQGIKDKILELTVPSEYLDLHFNLVIAFEMIEQGSKDSDQAKIESGLARIDKLSQDYSWLQ